MMRIRLAVFGSLFGTALLFALAGCEEDVTTGLGSDRAFSLYGFISPSSDTQYVRVFPVRGRLEPTSAAPIDAQFTSEDLQTGELRTWQDSLVQYHDSTYGHVFWSPFQAVAGHAYRLDVQRSDGARAFVEVDTPPRLTPVRQEPFVEFDRFGHVAAAVEPLLLRGGTPRLFKAEVEYWVKYDLGPESTLRIAIPYDVRAEAVEAGWWIDVSLLRDIADVRDELLSKGLWTPESSYGIYVQLITLRTNVVNENWALPGGNLDPDVLIEPGTFSNVEGGFGFVGSGYSLQHTWRPDEETVEAAGFTVCPCGEIWCATHPSCS